MKHPNEVPGSTLDSSTQDTVRLKILSRDLSKVSLSIKEYYEALLRGEKPDIITAPKFIGDQAKVAFRGLLSMTEDGKLAASKATRNPQPPIIYIDDALGRFVSNLSSQTVLGTHKLATKTAKIMNPFGDLFPSSFFTPTKLWHNIIYPELTKISSIDWIILMSAVAMMIRNKLAPDSIKEFSSSETKDLGLIVLDNQEIEQKLLDGRIGE